MEQQLILAVPVMFQLHKKIRHLLQKLDVSAIKVGFLLKSHTIHSPVELKKATTYLEKLVIELLKMLG